MSLWCRWGDQGAKKQGIPNDKSFPPSGFSSVRPNCVCHTTEAINDQVINRGLLTTRNSWNYCLRRKTCKWQLTLQKRNQELDNRSHDTVSPCHQHRQKWRSHYVMAPHKSPSLPKGLEMALSREKTLQKLGCKETVRGERCGESRSLEFIPSLLNAGKASGTDLRSEDELFPVRSHWLHVHSC